jgi:hypothetical protein
LSDDGSEQSGEQLRLPLLNTSGPPATRAGCADIARPCNRFSCRYHLWPDTERAGRPHHGEHPPAKLHPSSESCALDLAERESSRDQIAAHLNVTGERVRQIEERALMKLQVAKAVEEYLEGLRTQLPPGVRLETMYPRSNDAGAIYITMVISVDAHARKASGVVVRKRNKP